MQKTAIYYLRVAPTVCYVIIHCSQIKPPLGLHRNCSDTAPTLLRQKDVKVGAVSEYCRSSVGEDFKTPDYQTPDFQMSDFKTIDFQMPDFQTIDFKTPDFQMPDFQRILLLYLSLYIRGFSGFLGGFLGVFQFSDYRFKFQGYSFKPEN